MKRTLGEKIFQYVAMFILVLISASIIFPFLNIISVSLSSKEAVIKRLVTVWPVGLNFFAYKLVVNSRIFLRSLVNTVGLTIAGTFGSIILAVMVSFALTKEFPGKTFVKYYFIITMYFGGGLIPTYLLVSRYLNLRNTYWALLLPYLINVFYIIVIRSQIDNIPSTIFDAAYIDGASEFQTLFKVVIPVITPTIAAISMFFALGKWNSWFPVMIYTDRKEFWTLQYYLRSVFFERFINAKDQGFLMGDIMDIPEENIRMATIILVALPIVSIYPFVQKYFVKGIISGAIKG